MKEVDFDRIPVTMPLDHMPCPLIPWHAKRCGFSQSGSAFFAFLFVRLVIASWKFAVLTLRWAREISFLFPEIRLLVRDICLWVCFVELA